MRVSCSFLGNFSEFLRSSISQIFSKIFVAKRLAPILK